MTSFRDSAAHGASGSAAAFPAPSFSPRLDRTIINTQGGSVRHLVIGVKAPADEAANARPRLPLNLGLVIDASGSMGNGRLEAVKTATLGIIDSLAPADRLSIVSFASHVRVHLDTVRMDDEGKRAARLAVRPLRPRDNTDLAAGWLQGCERVAARQAEADLPERNHVILLSDGHANEGDCDPRSLAVHAAALHERGVITSTVGIGSGYSPSHLQAIAEAGGGRMHDAETPDEIVEIVMAELADALATTVEGLSISLLLPRDVKAELYGTASTTTRGTHVEMMLGSMRAGAVREVVVKLTCPPGTFRSRLEIEAAARWTHPAAAQEASCLLPAVEMVYGTTSACMGQPRDPALVRLVAAHWQASVLHRGVALNQDGQGEEARQLVEQERRYFRRYCRGVDGLEPLTSGLDEFLESLRHRFDAMAAKEVMLYAYKHSRGEADRRSMPRPSVNSIIQSQIDKHP